MVASSERLPLGWLKNDHHSAFGSSEKVWPNLCKNLSRRLCAGLSLSLLFANLLSNNSRLGPKQGPKQSDTELECVAASSLEEELFLYVDLCELRAGTTESGKGRAEGQL